MESAVGTARPTVESSSWPHGQGAHQRGVARYREGHHRLVRTLAAMDEVQDLAHDMDECRAIDEFMQGRAAPALALAP